ncbi:MAG: hypothetical protein H6807_17900 [Planctomycetes bacterium]|nr:hypothetical protein [Planctomycetota bacterium]
MHLLSLLYWIALLIPGFAVLRRWDRSLIDAGPLATISLSFVASLALLSPVSILGFLFGFPVWVLSAATILFVLWGIQDLVRNRAGDDLIPLVKGLLVAEVVLLGAVLWADARIGSKLGADALIHMARIRQFLDHGLTNVDPFVKGDHFYGIYHTNLFHALMASAAQLCGTDQMGVWFAFLPFANLLVAGGIAFLAYRIFPLGWTSWLAALFFLADQGRIDFMTYPNKLAPFFLIPIVAGLLIQTLAGRPTRKQALQLGLVCLVIAQFHGMYAVFTAALVGPALLGFAAWQFLIKRRNPTPWVAVGIAVLVALIWPAISKYDEVKTERETLALKIQRDADPNAVQVSSRARNLLVGKDADNAKFYTINEVAGFEVDWIMKDPSRGWGGGRGFRYWLLGGGLVLGLISARRRQVLLACCILASCAAFLYIPPLCTFLLWLVDARWIILRLETAAFPVLFPALAVGALGWWLDKLVESRAKVVFAALLFLFMAYSAKAILVGLLLALLAVSGLWWLLIRLPFKKYRTEPPYHWPHPWTRALCTLITVAILPGAFAYSGQATVGYLPLDLSFKKADQNWSWFWSYANESEEVRGYELAALRRNRFFLAETIPEGETILCRDTRAMEAVMLRDLHILAPLRSSSGVPALSYLRGINQMMINERLDWPTRSRLLKDYGIRFYLLQGNPKWYPDHVKVRDGRRQLFQDPEQPTWKLVELDPDS